MSYQELYNSVKWQNDIMENQNAKMRDAYSTDQRKVDFLISNIAFYTKINFILWIFFYLVVLVAIYFAFYGEKRDILSNRFKIFLIILFLLYPMVITPVELSIYYLVDRIYTLIFGMPFTGYFKNVPEFSLLSALPP